MITKLVSRILLLATAGSIATVGAANAAQAATTGVCSGLGGCITDQYTIPHVGDAVVFAKTSVPASAKLQLSVHGDRSGPVLTLSHRSATYSHTFKPTHLTQGATYDASLTVTAADGSQQVKKWPFRVFERRVIVTVQKIKVLRDGDEPGPGEVRAGIRPFGEEHAFVVNPVVPTQAPGTIFPDSERTFEGAPAASLMSLSLYEEDQKCPQPTLFPTGNGSDACGDWATATKKVSLDTGTYSTTQQITMSQDAGRLSFVADVKVEVVVW